MPAIATIAVIGAGATGRRIAQLVAQAGFRTILEDVLPSTLRNAEEDIRSQLHPADGFANGKSSETLSRIEFADSVENAARLADLVIETVPDELESKLEILVLLDRICRPHTILALTTSEYSISELVNVTFRPEKCLAMRFSHPISSLGRLEIVCGDKTSAATQENVVNVGRRLCREVAVSREVAELKVAAPVLPSS